MAGVGKGNKQRFLALTGGGCLFTSFILPSMINLLQLCDVKRDLPASCWEQGFGFDWILDPLLINALHVTFTVSQVNHTFLTNILFDVLL